MKRYDNHIHLRTLEVCPDRLLSELNRAGIWGANVLHCLQKVFQSRRIHRIMKNVFVMCCVFVKTKETDCFHSCGSIRMKMVFCRK